MLLGLLGGGRRRRAPMPSSETVFVDSSELLGIGAGALVIFALGAVDDLRDLPAPVKLAGQIFAAGILFLSGVKMQFLLLPDGRRALPQRRRVRAASPSSGSWR